MKVCTTCNREVTRGYVEFKCPKCLAKAIIRCDSCRAVSRRYVCEKCGFEGP